MRPYDDGHEPADGRRLLQAFLIAPLAAPAGYAVCLMGLGLVRIVFGSASAPSVNSVVAFVLAVAAIGIPITYAAAIVAALIYFLLRRFGAVSPLTIWLAGTAIGALVAVVLAPQLKSELFSIPFPLWAGSLLGLLSAEVFRRLLSTRGTTQDGGLAG